jgi:hypothetical protein
VKKPLLCRIGLHETFLDHVLTNVGTEEKPVYFGDTYETCDRCGWTTDPAGNEGVD